MKEYINEDSLYHIFCRNFCLRISCGSWNCCNENNNIENDRTNGAVITQKNTEHNRNTIHVPPTELEMVEPIECTNDKTKLFDGENNLKVISNNSFKPTSPCPSINQQPATALTTLSVNTINGSGSSGTNASLFKRLRQN